LPGSAADPNSPERQAGPRNCARNRDRPALHPRGPARPRLRPGRRRDLHLRLRPADGFGPGGHLQGDPSRGSLQRRRCRPRKSPGADRPCDGREVRPSRSLGNSLLAFGDAVRRSPHRSRSHRSDLRHRRLGDWRIRQLGRLSGARWLRGGPLPPWLWQRRHDLHDRTCRSARHRQSFHRQTAPAGLRAGAVDSAGRIFVLQLSPIQEWGGWSPHSKIQFLAFNPDGTPDSSFGGGQPVSVSNRPNSLFHDIAVDSRGRVLLGGAFGPRRKNFEFDGFDGFDVLRLRHDGSLDRRFGNRGWANARLGRTLRWLGTPEMTLLPNDRVMLGAAAIYGAHTKRAALARFQP
jgi:hypothetical protein